MSVTVTFDQIDKNRIFIDTGRVCTGACLYCYVPDFENVFPAGQAMFTSVELAMHAIVNEPSFTPGIHGTAFSIGCYADPLHSSCVTTTGEMLPHLLDLGNPIQMASKCFSGGERLARIISAHQRYPGQFTFLVTVTSFSQAGKVERGAPAPWERLNMLKTFQQAGINTALFIKPILPGITDCEVDVFAETIVKFEIRSCVIGLFYANPRILARFKRRKLPLTLLQTSIAEGHNFPNDIQKVLVQSNDDNMRDRFYSALQQRVDAHVFKTSMCVVAHRLKIPDPMRTWRRYPDLCVNCQDCEGLVTSLSPNLQQRYSG